MRRSTSAFGLGVLFVLLLVAHFTLRPVLDWRASVDFLVIGVLLVAVRARPGLAALVGCFAGAVADAIGPGSLGVAMLTLTVVGFGASWLKGAFFREDVVLNAAFLFLGKLAHDALLLAIAGRLGSAGMLGSVALWSSLSAAVTAAAGLAILLLFRPLIESDGDVR